MPEDIEKLKKDLEIARATQEIKDKTIIKLIADKNNIQKNLDVLQKARPKLKAENLTQVFRTALEKMQEGLTISKGQVDYRVGRFDVDLKVNVTLDENEALSFQLPYLEDIIPADNLSNLHLSLIPFPKARVIPEETVEIPNLIGMNKKAALENLEKFNLKVGKVDEQISQSPSHTIIGQYPEPYSIVPVDSEIDLIVSQVKEVKVPRLVGMKKDIVVQTIKQLKLAVGRIIKEISDSAPDTVISQSITADTIVLIGTPIDIVLAKPEIVEVPEVKGKTLREASSIITKSKLKVGKIRERFSLKPKGTVIRQKPLLGEKVAKGSNVDLIFAKSRR